LDVTSHATSPALGDKGGGGRDARTAGRPPRGASKAASQV
jgi:hypothetical protein